MHLSHSFVVGVVTDLDQGALLTWQDSRYDARGVLELLRLLLEAVLAERIRLRRLLPGGCIGGVHSEKLALVSEVPLTLLDYEHLPVGRLFESASRVGQVGAHLLDCRNEFGHSPNRHVRLILRSVPTSLLE